MKSALLRSLMLAAALAVPVAAIAAGPTTAPTNPPTTAPAAAAGSADEAYAALQAFRLPALDQTKRNDQAYVKGYIEQRDAALRKFADDQLAFVRAYPSDPRASGMAVSVVGLSGNFGDDASFQKTVDEMVGLPIADKAKSAIHAMVVQRKIMLAGDDLAAATKLVDDFVAQNPTDENAGQLNFMLAQRLAEKGDDSRLRKIAADSPQTTFGKMAAGALRQSDGIGKPFTLTFNDAITGKPVDVQSSLKGKVVVIDFWATWCGPCVAEMPNMKQLYAEYKDKGVEFIGVSLDQEGDGLDKLKEFVAKNGITWPQYYQGKGWDSEFSKSWGINAIPCVFVVGKDGNLLTNKGRGVETLKKIFDEQLAK